MNAEKHNDELCKHEKVTFRGLYSLVGVYVCDDCGKEIDPVEYARMYELPHRQLDHERN